LQQPTIACLDGSRCASGTTCVEVADTTVCASQDQLNVCANEADGAQCTLLSSTPGTCQAGVCVTSRVCGDGIVVGTEICDDGTANANTPNAACRPNCRPQRCGDLVVDNGEVCDGDASSTTGYCSYDCQSTGTCGNSYVDIQGRDFNSTMDDELCDQGIYGLGHDGCASNCRFESGDWRQVLRGQLARSRHVMVYDRQRKRMVAFGGINALGALGDTWEFSGRGWIQIPTVIAPPPRYDAAMAYDEARQEVVMFGGSSSSVTFDDTWTWDGVMWRQQQPATHPTARFGAAMAFDAKRGEAVLFGGMKAGVPSGETWRWNGTNWLNASATVGPTARRSAQMSYDQMRENIVLFGGIGSDADRETWLWNGTSWRQPSPRPTMSPPATTLHCLAYSDTTHEVLMIGRSLDDDTPEPSWIWNGTDWRQGSDSIPSNRFGQTMAYDNERQEFIVLGGQTHDQTIVGDSLRIGRIDDTIDDAYAVRQIAAAIPDPLSDHSLTYSSSTGETLLFGGQSTDLGFGQRTNNDIWSLQGGAWTKLQPETSSPERRRKHASAFDPLRGKLILFGGKLKDLGTTEGVGKDLWEFDPVAITWKEIPIPVGALWPPEISGASLVFDTSQNRMMLSGGSLLDGAAINDVWQWDSTSSTWSKATPQINPMRNQGDTVAYDQRRGRAVLYGNAGTWLWNGVDQTWTKMPLGDGPGQRTGQSMVYDPVRANVIMFGGQGLDFGPRNDAWEWDGTAWHELQFATLPFSRQNAALAYDALTSRIVMFGGQSSEAVNLNDTWELAYRSNTSPSESCLSKNLDADRDGLFGCDDPDCWGRCTPTCPPYTQCDTAAMVPRCGDDFCSAVESSQLCPGDCP
jgi:hypothetical protein